MRRVCLFIAMSLDGYIADAGGGVGWLGGQDGDSENPDTYAEFAKTVDTVIMGWNTYHQIVTELSPEAWPYPDFTTYVITHRECASSERIRFVSTDPSALLNKLREESGKNLWICGGAGLVQQLVRADAIDEYRITVIPTLLGSGIRLFDGAGREIKLRLLHTRSDHGMTDLLYTRREP